MKLQQDFLDTVEALQVEFANQHFVITRCGEFLTPSVGFAEARGEQ